MNGPVAIPEQMLALRNLAGEEMVAPVVVWLGCLLVSLPPKWREDIIDSVRRMQPMAAAPLVTLAR